MYGLSARRLFAVFAVASMLMLPALMMIPEESEAAPLDYSEEFYYNQLSEREQGLYRQIYSAATDFRESFPTGYGDGSLDGVGQKVLRAVRCDHPELVQLANDSFNRYSEKGEMFLKYACTKEQLKETQDAIETFCDGMSVDETDRSTIVEDLNATIVRQTAYDKTAANAHDIKGVLVDGKAVCEGYALSFKFLCDLYDVPCICVIGNANNGTETELHMWNYVMVGSKWYAMDVTWNDPTPDEGPSAPVRTDYSLVGSETVIDGMTFFESHIADEISSEADLPEIETTEFVSIVGADGSLNFGNPSTYYYDQLVRESPDAAKAYRAIVEGLLNYDTSIETGVTDNNAALLDALRAIRFDRQDLFQLPNEAGKITVFSDGKVEITYTLEKDKYDAMSAEILASLVDLEAKLSVCTSEYDKVLTIHDHLVSNIQYVDGKNSHNIYGALVEKKCVCEGYARSFQYICSLYGIDVICVSGDGDNGTYKEAHMWNMIRMNDGKWYYMDVTWDDPLVNGSDSGKVYYDYFLVGSATKNSKDLTFAQSHVPDMASKDPGSVFSNAMLPAGSEVDYYIRPNSDPLVEVEVTVGGSAGKYTATATKDALVAAQDMLQGHGSAVIKFGDKNAKIEITNANLGHLIAYMDKAAMDSVVFGYDTRTDKVALGPMELDNLLHSFSVMNGSEKIAFKNIDEKFGMTVYIPYEKPAADVIDPLIFAWDSATAYMPLFSSKYADGYVSLTIDSDEASYFVGSTPIQDVPVLYVVAGIAGTLLVLYILLRHHAKKKAKKREAKRRSRSSR